MGIKCAVKTIPSPFLREKKRRFEKKVYVKETAVTKITGIYNSTFPNACGEALLAKRQFMARADGECRNEFR